MIRLLTAALIWAFSFGLIKNQLGGLDPSFVAAARLLVSLAVFLPLLRLGAVPGPLRPRLVIIGGLQYGLMYLAYIAAFRYLLAYQVALFTIFTPIYVTLIDDLLERRVRTINLLTALLAVIGTGIVSYGGLGERPLLLGALLMQASNLCFALGQIAYRRVLGAATSLRDRDAFALLYLGGAVTAGLAAAVLTPWSALTLAGNQLIVLLYLGALPSGLGFFLWNSGARRVEVDTLAIMNDLKIPLAVVVSLLFFGERAQLGRLAAGTLLVLAALALQQWTLARRAPH